MSRYRRKTEEGTRPLLKKWDVIIISFFVMISFLPALIFHGSQELTVGAKEIVVEKDGKEIYRKPLPEDEEALLEFPFIHDGKDYMGNLEVKNGAVKLHRLPEEIVPLSIHEEMGWISESYEIIVALPIRLIITVESQAESEVDVIVQ